MKDGTTITKPKRRKPKKKVTKKKLSRKWNSRAILWPCMDCGREIQPVRDGKRVTWFVSDELWKSQGLTKNDLLCLECFEKRLGRKLGWEEFSGGTCTTISRERWRRELRAYREGWNLVSDA
jgi:hypothetical protein